MLKIINTKKIFSLLVIFLSLVICVFILLSNDDAHASENKENGFLSLSFEILDDGVLEIDGADIGRSTLDTGDMHDIDKELQDKGLSRDFIKEIKIKKVNTIELGTLKNFNNCKKITIKECATSMTNINKNAISDMPNLEILEIGDALWKWKNACVWHCPNLRYVELYYTHKDDYDELGTSSVLNERITTGTHTSYIKDTDVYMTCHIRTEADGGHEKEFEATMIGDHDVSIWHEQYSSLYEGNRMSRTHNYCIELPMKNNRKVFEVQSTKEHECNYIDYFPYHIRGYAGHPEREKSVQFFLNKSTGEIRFVAFEHYKANLLENKYFLSTGEDAEYKWHIGSEHSYEDRVGETLFEHDLILPNGTDHIKLSENIKTMKIDPKINEITQCSFRSLHNLKEVKFLDAEECVSTLVIASDVFSECWDYGQSMKLWFKKAIDTKKLFFRENWASHYTTYEIV